MIRTRRTLLLALVAPVALVAQPVTPIPIRGVRAPVTLTRDSAGVVHIRAANEHDLFFAQGWNAARDRLFQLELWRRQATGTLAEVLGPAAVAKDVASRAFRFRGDMARELAHYHPRGATIIRAFVDGINAYIGETEKNGALLPPELRWLGWRPKRWTPAVVVSRHNGLAQNADAELDLARAVSLLGEGRVRSLLAFAPDPVLLQLDTALASIPLSASAIARFTDRTAPVPFSASHLDATVRAASRTGQAVGAPTLGAVTTASVASGDTVSRMESNNWVVSGRRTASGLPLLANDPHRAILAPSLRYFVHLEAPGWNVIGGGEPTLPGISIGHNEHGAWGLTIFGLDTEDVYVYRLKPGDPTRYWHRGRWEAMRAVAETIAVRGARDTVVTLHFTRHGPVTRIDSASHVAYAVRAAWLDVGGAPYLASLRFASVRTWREFRAATTYHRMPAENLVWADRHGTIGWQAVGFAPIRRGWTGLLPVPGDGRYEWQGYLPIGQLPSRANPPEGHLATANEMNVPTSYAHPEAVGRQWAEPWRVQRLREVLDTTTRATVGSMASLQQDVESVFSRTLLARLRARHPWWTTAPVPPPRCETALTRVGRGQDSASHLVAGQCLLLDADGRGAQLATGNVAGAAAILLEREVQQRVRRALPESAHRAVRSVGSHTLLSWVDSASQPALDDALRAVAREAVARGLLPMPSREALRHVQIRHPLSAFVRAEVRDSLDTPRLPRPGAQHTVNVTGTGDLQSHGASFRVVIDVADWDASVGTNTPGQSGDPRSPFHHNLFGDWAAGRAFPLPFSAAAVARLAMQVERLLPVRR